MRRAGRHPPGFGTAAASSDRTGWVDGRTGCQLVILRGSMNNGQRTIAAVGGVLLAANALFPPRHLVGGRAIERTFLLSPSLTNNSRRDGFFEPVQVHVGALLAYLIVIGGITVSAVAVAGWSRKPPRNAPLQRSGHER